MFQHLFSVCSDELIVLENNSNWILFKNTLGLCGRSVMKRTHNCNKRMKGVNPCWIGLVVSENRGAN